MSLDCILICALAGFTPVAAQSNCGGVQLQLSPDYSFAIGSSNGGTAYSFSIGGQTIAQGAMTQLALFHYDMSLGSTSGIMPVQAVGTSLVPGKFGSAVEISVGGNLSYPAAGNVSSGDGTVEMWVAPLYDGTNLVYTTDWQPLFVYQWGDDGNALGLAMSQSNGGYFYAVAAQVYAGYSAVSGIGAWKAGQWHHLAFTYSTSQGRLRIYVDGTLADETDAAIQIPPAGGSATFSIGSADGNTSDFVIDEVRVSNIEMSAAAIASDANRITPFGNDEVDFSLSGVPAGQLTYTVSGCGTASYPFPGIPVTSFLPVNGLLPPGSTSVPVSFTTLEPTTCRYSVGSPADFGSMQALDTGPPSTAHAATVNGISPDPRVVNQVYIRCASNSDYLRTQTYRTLAPPGQTFPRIGNIWLGQFLYFNAPENASKTQLFLGPGLTAAQAIQLRSANPGVLILPSVNVTDTGEQLPEDYYLKDTHGNTIADWCVPPLHVLNVTRPEVQQYLGNLAYQLLSQSNFAFDGLFFDSFSTSIPQPFTDCYGNVVEISSQNNGVADDPQALSAAWSAGEYGAVNAFRNLAPYAYVSGHVLEAPAQGPSLAAFNGTSIEFYPQSVREGNAAFGTLWDLYHAWETQSVTPPITMIQACPPDQLSYGYGYAPLKALLPGTIAFAQSSYANMRFGLGVALMNGGFFGFDFGDEAPPITWWYDEFDFQLGYPITPAELLSAQQSGNIVINGGFEQGLADWQLNVFNDGHAQAAAAPDQTIAAEGIESAHITITSPGTINWHVDFEQDNLSFSQGAEYLLQFWARADSARTITVFSQGGAPNYPNYGLSAQIAITTSWSLYSVSFTSSATAEDGRLEFWVGDVAGNVWLDDVQITQQPLAVYRRDFSNGTVLLNGTATQQTVSMEAGFQRFTGTQAPLYQYMVDDSSSSFSTSGGEWKTVVYNTGAYSSAGSGTTLPPDPQHASGPYYHCWEGSCHELDSGSGSAEWNLNIPADGQYTIQVWLPAAPNAANWTKAAAYEVVSAGKVIASATIDQTTASAGDGLHMIGTMSLTAAGAPILTIHNAGSSPLIADAVYVMSAALYNDGSPAHEVTLAPFDAILLERQQPVPAPASAVTSVASAASLQPGIASDGLVSVVGTGFGTSTKSWSQASFPDPNLPTSINGISVTINGKKAYVAYVSPLEVKVIAPDDETIGQVAVQVTTPQGASYPGSVLKQRLAPAFFTTQTGTTTYAVALHQDGTMVGSSGPSSRPATPGEVIKIHGTGFGATAPPTPASMVVVHPMVLALPVTVSIGGTNAQVQWAGLISSGVYEIDVTVPSFTSGDQAVQASVSGFQTPANVFLPVSAN